MEKYQFCGAYPPSKKSPPPRRVYLELLGNQSCARLRFVDEAGVPIENGTLLTINFSADSSSFGRVELWPSLDSRLADDLGLKLDEDGSIKTV